MYLTSKYAERWPPGKRMMCSIALFTAEWMLIQQVIVGVCSRFGRILFGRSVQSCSSLNNAACQMAITCN